MSTLPGSPAADAGVVALIQARISSSRLPGKVLRPLGHGTVLDQVVDRAAAFAAQVVVCTSVDESDDAIVRHCEARGTIWVRGPLEDVFARFRAALADPRVIPSAWFARITADCPLVSVSLAQRMIGAIADGVDYIAADAAALPRGIAIELVRRSTFMAIEPRGLDAAEREHVTLHLYERPGRYRCVELAPPPELVYPEFRLTLDYSEDYELLRRLFADRGDELDAESAIATLQARPDLAQLNQHCVQRSARNQETTR